MFRPRNPNIDRLRGLHFQIVRNFPDVIKESASIPGIQENQVCDMLIGAFGESVFWIRPESDQFFGYVGGDFQKTRKSDTHAYFFASVRTVQNPAVTLAMFRDAFDGKRVKKLSGTNFENIDLAKIGFSELDDLDKERVIYFNALPKPVQTSHGVNIKFDERFLYKIGYAICYALYGPKIAKSPWGKKAKFGITHSNNDGLTIHGQCVLNNNKEFAKLKEYVHYDLAPLILLMPTPRGLAVYLSLGRDISNIIDCEISKKTRKSLKFPIDKEGTCLILCKPLRKSVTISFEDFLKHKNRIVINQELRQIEELAKGRQYFNRLAEQFRALSSVPSI